MSRLINAQLRSSGKRHTFEMEEGDVSLGDTVIVDTEFGADTAKVLSAVSSSTLGADRKFRRVIRVATEEDLKKIEENSRLEEEGREYCLERIRSRNLPMRLVATEITFDKKKFSFYFTADKRVDFRELVKDLASKFRTRIELRQIGIRDEARMLGGLGGCGREVCCKLFLNEFAPISIKMAKKQELALNPTKISGRCGRLMCCLSYEYSGGAKKDKGKVSVPEPETEKPLEETAREGLESVPAETPDETVAVEVEETSPPAEVLEKPPKEKKRGRGERRRRGRRKARTGKEAQAEGKARAETASQPPQASPDAGSVKPAPESGVLEARVGQEVQKKKSGRRRRRRRRGKKKSGEENKT